jgi:hypothetical protein
MNKKIIVELLKKKSFWEEKKNKYSSQYNNWVENSWLNNFTYEFLSFIRLSLSFKLPVKIEKCSRKITLIDKKIAKELSE